MTTPKDQPADQEGNDIDLGLNAITSMEPAASQEDSRPPPLSYSKSTIPVAWITGQSQFKIDVKLPT